ncbi:hypothetical protein SODALDRAFT_334013 [Sodiomyces alkalinus F11]|uniref:Glucose-methanol-choline oxidoreductase N-terminal domain-containing protein n=1 Tax=Sodiomyces alkalinus (strain CBS 110278 / VKM F-3762 / F11) TaxID=1314773 RepID=A0A3N2PUQ8_SODAK|nr:hypothetical protein SODALDRAFT_334013 [Sodiomyces alkalinus F11]ROT38245.1 hypothetical protein SODALDRAFT_334013 [Sodiomyces alkalinus F11]
MTCDFIVVGGERHRQIQPQVSKFDHTNLFPILLRPNIKVIYNFIHSFYVPWGLAANSNFPPHSWALVGTLIWRTAKGHQLTFKSPADRGSKEVVLSAGALDSPKILMHPGIGPRKQLEQFGIPVVRDVPAVGQGLRVHMSCRLVYTRKGGRHGPRVVLRRPGDDGRGAGAV